MKKIKFAQQDCNLSSQLPFDPGFKQPKPQQAEWLKYYESLLARSLENFYRRAEEYAKAGNFGGASEMLRAAEEIVKSKDTKNLHADFVKKIKKVYKKNAKCILGLLQSGKNKREDKMSLAKPLSKGMNLGTSFETARFVMGCVAGRQLLHVVEGQKVSFEKDLFTCARQEILSRAPKLEGVQDFERMARQSLKCLADQQRLHVVEGQKVSFEKDLFTCAQQEILRRSSKLRGKMQDFGRMSMQSLEKKVSDDVASTVSAGIGNAGRWIVTKVVDLIEAGWRYLTTPRRSWLFKRVEHTWYKPPQNSMP